MDAPSNCIQWKIAFYQTLILKMDDRIPKSESTAENVRNEKGRKTGVAGGMRLNGCEIQYMRRLLAVKKRWHAIRCCCRCIWFWCSVRLMCLCTELDIQMGKSVWKCFDAIERSIGCHKERSAPYLSQYELQIWGYFEQRMNGTKPEQRNAQNTHTATHAIMQDLYWTCIVHKMRR